MLKKSNHIQRVIAKKSPWHSKERPLDGWMCWQTVGWEDGGETWELGRDGKSVLTVSSRCPYVEHCKWCKDSVDLPPGDGEA